MKVIGVGVGRTGTLSLKAALERLGFGPCFHMRNVLDHRERLPLWEAAAAGSTVDWEAVFAGYESSVDWPGAAFWRELTAHYPDAKVILTVRDPERWYDSVRDTIYQLFGGGTESPLAGVQSEAGVGRAVPGGTLRRPRLGHARISPAQRGRSGGDTRRTAARLRGQRRLGTAVRLPRR